LNAYGSSGSSDRGACGYFHGDLKLVQSQVTSAAPAFALLEKPAVSSTSELMQVIGQPGAAAWQREGVDASQARATSVSGHQLWIAAGQSQVRVAVQRVGAGGVSSCAPTLIADTSGETFTIPNPDGSVTVTGILPDGAADLSVDVSNGGSSRLGLTDSAFWSTPSSAPTALLVWPESSPLPRWRLIEAWTVAEHGPYMAVAGGFRLAFWSENAAHHGPRLDRALARYARYADARPAGFPAAPGAAFARFLACHTSRQNGLPVVTEQERTLI
jgi:hypothetical protein